MTDKEKPQQVTSCTQVDQFRADFMAHCPKYPNPNYKSWTIDDLVKLYQSGDSKNPTGSQSVGNTTDYKNLVEVCKAAYVDETNVNLKLSQREDLQIRVANLEKLKLSEEVALYRKGVMKAGYKYNKQDLATANTLLVRLRLNPDDSDAQKQLSEVDGKLNAQHNAQHKAGKSDEFTYNQDDMDAIHENIQQRTTALLRKAKTEMLETSACARKLMEEIKPSDCADWNAYGKLVAESYKKLGPQTGQSASPSAPSLALNQVPVDQQRMSELLEQGVRLHDDHTLVTPQIERAITMLKSGKTQVIAA